MPLLREKYSVRTARVLQVKQTNSKGPITFPRTPYFHVKCCFLIQTISRTKFHLLSDIIIAL